MRHRLIDQLLESELPEGGKILARGTTVPTNGVAGYSKGCLFVDTDSTGEGALLFCNIGTYASANFNLVTVAGD